MKRNPISYTVKQIVFARDRYKCVHCGREPERWVVSKRKNRLYLLPIDSDNRCFEIDHVIPYIETKSNDINNLCTSCWECNNRKSNRKLAKNFPQIKLDIRRGK